MLNAPNETVVVNTIVPEYNYNLAANVDYVLGSLPSKFSEG